MPYPLGHTVLDGFTRKSAKLYLAFLWTGLQSSFRNWLPLIYSHMPYPLGHRTLGSNIDNPLPFDVQQLQSSYPVQNCFIIRILSQLNKSVTPQSSLSQGTCKKSSSRSKTSEGICQILSPSHSGLSLSKRFDLITQWTKSTVVKSQDRNASPLAIVPSNLLYKVVWWLRLQKSFFIKGRLQPNTIATRVDRMWD